MPDTVRWNQTSRSSRLQARIQVDAQIVKDDASDDASDRVGYAPHSLPSHLDRFEAQPIMRNAELRVEEIPDSVQVVLRRKVFPPMKMTVRVVDVIDGASFRVSSGGIVRLRGVAAPGLLTPAGLQARARLEELVLHKHVQCEELDSDPDGNVIARVWADGQDVNAEMDGEPTALRPVTPTGPRAEKKVEVQIDETVFNPSTSGDRPGLRTGRD